MLRCKIEPVNGFCPTLPTSATSSMSSHSPALSPALIGSTSHWEDQVIPVGNILASGDRATVKTCAFAAGLLLEDEFLHHSSNLLIVI